LAILICLTKKGAAHGQAIWKQCKAKCWSNFLKLCLDNKTFSVSSLAGFSEEEKGWMCSPLPSILDHFLGVQNPDEQADSKG
jgi:hypothetical protein